MKLWDKADSVVLRNFFDYWKDPLINKFLNSDASNNYEGILILRKGKKPVWLSHPFHYPEAKNTFKNNAIVVSYKSMQDIKNAMHKYTGKIVGYNPKHQTVTSFKNLHKFLKGRKFVDVEDQLEDEREIKTLDEIKKITTASRETIKVLKLTKKWLRIGVTEIEIERKIREKFEEDGFTLAFPIIVAFGKNTEFIHHIPTNNKLKYGPVLIDLGAKYKGYCSDFTESYYFGEEKESVKKSKSYKEYTKIKNRVEKCLLDVEALLKPGTKASKLWKATKQLGEHPYALGHGVGLEAHDYPIGIGPKSRYKLKEGMILAIEPGLHKKNLGIRIEKNYLITKKGYTKLS